MFKVFPFINVNILSLELIIIQAYTTVLSKERLFPGVSALWLFSSQWGGLPFKPEFVVLHLSLPHGRDTLVPFSLLISFQEYTLQPLPASELTSKAVHAKQEGENLWVGRIIWVKDMNKVNGVKKQQWETCTL